MRQLELIPPEPLLAYLDFDEATGRWCAQTTDDQVAFCRDREALADYCAAQGYQPTALELRPTLAELLHPSRAAK